MDVKDVHGNHVGHDLGRPGGSNLLSVQALGSILPYISFRELVLPRKEQNQSFIQMHKQVLLIFK